MFYWLWDFQKSIFLATSHLPLALFQPIVLRLPINLCNEFWQLSNHFAHMLKEVEANDDSGCRMQDAGCWLQEPELLLQRRSRPAQEPSPSPVAVLSSQTQLNEMFVCYMYRFSPFYFSGAELLLLFLLIALRYNRQSMGIRICICARVCVCVCAMHFYGTESEGERGSGEHRTLSKKQKFSLQVLFSFCFGFAFFCC